MLILIISVHKNIDINNNMYNFVARWIITIIYILLLFVIYPTNVPYIPLIVGTSILDTIDCGVTKLFYKYSCQTHQYQSNDKLIDLMTYVLVIIIFWNYLPDNHKNILLIALFWRMIGVIRFYDTNNSKYMIIFPDLFKELLLLYYLDSLNIINVNMYSIGILTIIKIFYEYLHHKIKIIPGLSDFLQINIK